MSGEAKADDRALLAESLWRHEDPEIRSEFKKLIGRAHPLAKSQMPEVVVQEEGAKLLEEGRKLRDEWRKERDEERNSRARKDWHAELVNGFRAPDGSLVKVDRADLPAIEKYMVEEAIGNPKVAAFAFVTQKRVAAPAGGYEPVGIQVPGRGGAGGDFFKGIMENTDQWGREKAHQIWNDLRNGNGQQWLDN